MQLGHSLRRCIAVIAALVGALSTASAHAGSTVRIATGDLFAPYVDERMPGGGIATMIVHAAWAAVGYDMRIEMMAWPEAEAAAARGSVDGVFPYVATPERKGRFLYSDPIFKPAHGIIGRPQVIGALTRLDDLAGRTQCVADGWALLPEIRHLHPPGAEQIARVPAFQDCLFALLTGSADFVTSDQLTALIALRAARIEAHEVSIRTDLLPAESFHILIGRKHPNSEALLQGFNAGLAIVLADEKLRQDLIRVMPELIAPTTIERMIDAAQAAAARPSPR